MRIGGIADLTLWTEVINGIVRTVYHCFAIPALFVQQTGKSVFELAPNSAVIVWVCAIRHSL
ncbi:hypothetical protein WL61_11100 [Burkholderia ubonensis]|nr:hypothetical protein WK14_26370 [Burkholderia ubonensis]KWD23042.1 hypothetical protein WL61_11100 [Burkholderia ubonensis]